MVSASETFHAVFGGTGRICPMTGISFGSLHNGNVVMENGKSVWAEGTTKAT